ncbi:ribosome maturation factor RimM [Methylomonas sp. MO1]|uniref:ribosome maturation factor RimM n=1 Tax=unclassified Methylomonas TaxID=2608980 RepID=UPI000372DE05|nr:MULTISPECIES: ribosome maturation factor RimM [unclassified Methylomonas]MDT4288719.1 ribosome maturation factor RimM [Methylomonas sp. MO1]
MNVGQVSGVFGVKGWVKVYSFTDPRENILQYSPWILQKNSQIQEVKLLGGRRQGSLVVAELQGINDRDLAAELMGADILIRKQQLPKASDGEYYWADLIGLEVRNQEGCKLGKVDHLLETGANDVLVVVDGDVERLIPFLQQSTILKIDLDDGLIIVDWDPDF